jgi:uncharacterized protein involved in exopolysaccharide biosynthesis
MAKQTHLTMNASTSETDAPAPLSRSIFLRLFIPVCLITILSATIITFIRPESFMSVARVKADPGAALDFLRSDATFKRVAERLQLDSAWSARYGGGQKLIPGEVLQLLKSRVEIRPLSSTSLTEIIEIKAFSEQPQEAADIANALAKATRPQAEIIDQAAVAQLPIRPNKPLNITLGILIGVALGSLAGLLGVFLSRGFKTSSGAKIRALLN